MTLRTNPWCYTDFSSLTNLSIVASDALLDYEADFTPLRLRYDGKFGGGEDARGGLLTEAEMRSAAADFADVPESELRELLDYEGTDGRRCYQVGGRELCVSRAGVESLSCSRLVWEEKLDMDQARRTAEDFLRQRGFGETELLAEEQSACLALFRYARVQDEVLCPDCVLRIAIALDDGSVYFFDASAYRPEPSLMSWPVDEGGARAASVERRVAGLRRLAARSRDGREDERAHEDRKADRYHRRRRAGLDGEDRRMLGDDVLLHQVVCPRQAADLENLIRQGDGNEIDEHVPEHGRVLH